MSHDTIQVNFGKALPLFPLGGVVLLPHALQPLHIFEPRYQQMIEESLDGAGQIAMATFDSLSKGNGHALRPIACVGQIVQHERLDNGRHNIVLVGVCRAKIVEVLEPSEERLYRLAKLQPIEAQNQDVPLSDVRGQIRDLLTSPALSRMRSVNKVVEWFDREDVPTQALLELVGFTLLDDPERKYRLLAEPDPGHRANLIKQELRSLDLLVRRADRQTHREWPKGLSWN